MSGHDRATEGGELTEQHTHENANQIVHDLLAAITRRAAVRWEACGRQHAVPPEEALEGLAEAETGTPHLAREDASVLVCAAWAHRV